MGISNLTELGPSVDMGVLGAGGKASGYSTRQRCELVRSQLEMERASFISHWKELTDYILPRRGRFYVSDVNKGDRRSRNILDSTATMAARTLSAGMMSGVTSPARPWFRLTVPDQGLSEQEDVKAWLFEVEQRMHTVFGKSNLYDTLQVIYSDLGVFGTAAMAVYEDDEDVIRCYDFPIGSYAIANDKRMNVRTFSRVFRYTVLQVVEEWGNIQDGVPDFMRGEPTTLSRNVQTLWRRGAIGAWIDLVHLVQTNVAYDGSKLDAKYKRYSDIYYELGASGAARADVESYGLLSHKGFDEFPVLVPRWEKNSEDVYGTNCPGMTALGDIKELQTRTKRTAQAVEKMINPPMTAPSVLRNAKASLLPGDITYQDIREGQQGFRPAHEINFGAAFGPMEQGSQQTRLRIQRAMFEDLFLMLAQSDRREITAREIDERHEEKLLALGPVLERLNSDMLDPLIERTFAIMQRKGLIPDPPESLNGTAVQVDYVSVMAQAQKMVGLASLERFAGFAGQVAQFSPSVLDNIDTDALIEQYGEATGTPPKIILPKEQVMAARQAREQAQAAQAAAQNAPGIAGAVKDLGDTPMDGNNALAALLGKANARKTLNATAQPVAA
ncbi:MAG: putative phage head-tail connector protein [Gemmatimonadetes bacterium]|nr:putative phage head-tail connector protein [Gemmatimonadota bacterium]